LSNHKKSANRTISFDQDKVG